MSDLKNSEYKVVREFVERGEMQLAEFLQRLCEHWKKCDKDPHFLDRLDESSINPDEEWEEIVSNVEQSGDYPA